MYALNVHVTSAHSIRIGDPLNRWLQAAQAWDKYLEENPDYESDYEESAVNKAELGKKTASPMSNKPPPPAKTGSYPSSGNEREEKPPAVTRASAYETTDGGKSLEEKNIRTCGSTITIPSRVCGSTNQITS